MAVHIICVFVIQEEKNAQALKDAIYFTFFRESLEKKNMLHDAYAAEKQQHVFHFKLSFT